MKKCQFVPKIKSGLHRPEKLILLKFGFFLSINPHTDFPNINELCDYITQVIIDAATASIPLVK